MTQIEEGSEESIQSATLQLRHFGRAWFSHFVDGVATASESHHSGGSSPEVLRYEATVSLRLLS